jgi:hypothetical protein
LILSGVSFGVGMYYLSQKFQKLKLKGWACNLSYNSYLLLNVTLFQN